MGAIVASLEVQPGKLGALRRYVTMVSGAPSSAHRASREQLGIYREMSWLQHVPGGQRYNILLATNTSVRTMRGLRESEADFDRDVRAFLAETCGIDLSPSGRGLPQTEQLFGPPIPLGASNMPFMMSAFPVADVGKLRELTAELSGPRAADFARSRATAGIGHERIWQQFMPDGSSMSIVLMEGDVAKLMVHSATSQDPFDEWFRGAVEAAHFSGFDSLPPLPPETLVSYTAAVPAIA